MEKDESSLSVAEEGPANAKSKLPQDENASIIWVKGILHDHLFWMTEDK